MTRYTLNAALIGGCIIAAAALHATLSQPPRYQFALAEGPSVYRLNSQTGDVSVCAPFNPHAFDRRTSAPRLSLNCALVPNPSLGEHAGELQTWDVP